MSKLHKDTYNSSSHEWQTPPELVDNLLNFFDLKEFDLDVCCSETNIPAKRHFINTNFGVIDSLNTSYTSKSYDSSINMKWRGHCFMNPPYGRDLEKFIKKGHKEWTEDNAIITAVLPVRLETKYWHKYVLSASWVVFLNGKIGFVDPSGQQKGKAGFAVAVVHWGYKLDMFTYNQRFRMNPFWPGTMIKKA